MYSVLMIRKISDVNAPGNLTLRIPHETTTEIPSLLQNLEDNSSSLGVNELSMNLSSLEVCFSSFLMFCVVSVYLTSRIGSVLKNCI